MSIDIQYRWVDVETIDGTDQDDQGELFFVARTTAGEDEKAVRKFAKESINSTRDPNTGDIIPPSGTTSPVIPTNYSGILIPPDYDGLGVTQLRTQRTESDNAFHITAVYRSRADAATFRKLEAGECRWTMRTSQSGTAKMTHSRGLVQEIYAPPELKYETTPLETALGVKWGDHGAFEKQGIDVSVGTILVDVQAVVSSEHIDAGYILNCATWAVQRCTNANDWSIFPAGTLKILDFIARSRSVDPRATAPDDVPDYDVAFVMEYQPNLTAVQIGDLGTVDKKGHQHLDLTFGKKEINRMPASVPVRAAVHDIFPTVQFADDLKLVTLVNG